MKAFFGFIVKEFYHIFRDRRTMLILFGMPLVQLLLFGYAIRNELNQADIAILDYSQDETTREITDKLLSTGYLNLSTRLETESEIDKVFQRGLARGVIVFEQNFDQRLVRERKAHINIITDASEPNMAQMLEGYISRIIGDYQRELNERGASLTGRSTGSVGGTASNLIGGTGSASAGETDSASVGGTGPASAGGSGVASGIMPQTRMFFNPELRSANLFVPGLIAFILMLVSAFLTSITIAREKEMGTMEVLLVSPLNPLQIILGKVLPYLALSVINVFTILVVALGVFQVPFRGSMLLFTLLCLLFIMTALALGLRISSVVSDQQTAMMISLAGLLLPTILLSGFIFPVSNMPVILQWISHIVPAKWFLIILRGIMLKGAGLQHLWMETLILVGMMLVLLVSSIRSFKIRLE